MPLSRSSSECIRRSKPQHFGGNRPSCHGVKKGTTGKEFLEFFKQVLTTPDIVDLKSKYPVLDNPTIHKTQEAQHWNVQRRYEIISFLPPYSPFLNPFKEFWVKLKNMLYKDPASVRHDTQLSEGIRTDIS
ncbi:hypothetical protein DFQ30_007259 [Apophysomyces sp. BC1015]|nr:hypothetical protein DFQ30_007259 [Apophysomyces sp. BC1015]KAG0181901.1 hypothetical protein DFQ29_006567 [Apophysomyces sp. BC1021]